MNEDLLKELNAEDLDNGQMATAAGCYLVAHPENHLSSPPTGWPWPFRFWTPADTTRGNLAIASHLIASEIIRLDGPLADTDATTGE